jgi:putative FmdB family regulatory protein
LPIYEYRCTNRHTFEVMQSMNDDPVATCTECGAPVERVFHPVAVHFKGSGFYTTDYGRGRSTSSDSGSASDGAKTESKEPASAKSDSGLSAGSSESKSSGSSSSSSSD